MKKKEYKKLVHEYKVQADELRNELKNHEREKKEEWYAGYNAGYVAGIQTHFYNRPYISWTHTTGQNKLRTR